MKCAILGFGNRGKLYADIMKESLKEVSLTAVCDIQESNRKLAHEKYGVDQKMIFSDCDVFFNAGKTADALIIATMDRQHYGQTVQALRLGYDILLEKPISPDEDDCRKIKHLANELGRKVAICHVLRYTPFYGEIKKILDDGDLGEVVTLSQTENVGYWHQAHSFVRGNWRNSNESSPMILQKCCHDMDIIRWLIGRKCKAVSSFGALSYFTAENAPVGSKEKCVDCTVDCLYNAVNFYKKNEGWFKMFSGGNNDVVDVLKTSPFGRCVFRCDNNVVDHQVTNLLFEHNVTAQLTMTAFSNQIHRNIKIHGTKGEIVGDMEENKIVKTIFGEEEQVIDVTKLSGNLSGHGGGDARLLIDFFHMLEGKESRALTNIDTSVESHLMCFCAEKSRLAGGKVIEVKM